MADDNQPIEVNPSALPTSIGTALRYAVVFICGYAVTKNILPASTDVNLVTATVLAVASTGYGIYTAWRNHAHKMKMLPYTPNSVAQLKR